MVRLPATIQLGLEHDGQRVERVLVRALPGLKEPFALKLLHRERVLLDGRPLRRGARLPRAGRLEVLELAPRAAPRRPAPNPRIALTVRHADPDVIVVEKPAGLAMHPGPGHGSDTLQNALVARFPELLELDTARNFGLVQRLDRETSGLLVVARTVVAHEGLVAALTAREVDKRYRALVKGAPPTAAGLVQAPIEGREAASRWELLERVGSGRWVVSLLALHPPHRAQAPAPHPPGRPRLPAPGRQAPRPHEHADRPATRAAAGRAARRGAGLPSPDERRAPGLRGALAAGAGARLAARAQRRRRGLTRARR